MVLLKPDELKAALEAKRNFYRESVVRVPDYMPEVEGIFLGGCVDHGVGSSFRAKAHAHNSRQNSRNFDIHAGWICIRGIKRLGNYHTIAGDNGETIIVVDKPSRTLWHEYAHIITPGHSHDDTWRRAMIRLNQPIEKQYRKKEQP